MEKYESIPLSEQETEFEEQLVHDIQVALEEMYNSLAAEIEKEGRT